MYATQFRLLISLGLCTIVALAASPAFSLVGLPPDMPKITADSEAHILFPEADYPFVQKSNQCGATDWTHIVPERPLCFKGAGQCLDDFSKACDFHDRCYMWIGMSREDCDNGFLERMNHQCESGGTHAQQTRCKALAKVYYDAVHWEAKPYFKRIQHRQALYETWLKTWSEAEEKRKTSDQSR